MVKKKKKARARRTPVKKKKVKGRVRRMPVKKSAMIIRKVAEPWKPVKVPPVPEHVRIAEDFTALAREGIIGQFRAVQTLVPPMWVPSTSMVRNDPRLRNLFNEVPQQLIRKWSDIQPIDVAALFGDPPKEKERPEWGGMFQRVRRMTRLPMTKTGIVWREEISQDLLLTTWVEVFTDAIRRTIRRRPKNEHVRRGLEKIVEELSVSPLTKGTARPYVTALENDADGAEVLRAVERSRRDLVDQISAIIIEVFPPAPMKDTAESVPTSKAEWGSTTAVFVHLFQLLQKGGYLIRPMQGGKRGDGNESELLRRVLQGIEVKGEDGQPLTFEQVRQRLAGRQLSDEKSAKIVLPPAKELE